ncbi:MAG TPA: ABC transporter permease [Candidatus Limnocylindria bacterium]
MSIAITTARPRRSSALGDTLRGIYIVWYRDLLRYWRDRVRAIVGLAQPLLFLVVFGAGLGSSLGGSFSAGGPSGSLSYAQFVYPGVVGMAVLFSAIFGAMSIVWDREFGFLKEILVAPIDRSAVAIGKALGGATQAMIQGLVLLVLAPLIGVKLDIGSVLLLIPFLFVLAFALSAMGVALASRMKSMQGFQIVMNFLLMPLFFLSGSLFPLTNVPDWMAVLGRLDPVSYGMDPIRRIVLGATLPAQAVDSLGLTLFGHVLPIGLEALILLAFGAVMLGLGVVNFRRRE